MRRVGLIGQYVAVGLAGLAAGVVFLFAGPKHWVVCTEAGWPNSMFGDQFGHGDGPTATYCLVPNTLSWTVATLCPIVAIAFLVSVRRSTPLRPPSEPFIRG